MMMNYNVSQSPNLTLNERRNLYCSYYNVEESKVTLAQNLIDNHILSVRNIPEVINNEPTSKVANIFPLIKSSAFSCKEIVAACASNAFTWQMALFIQVGTQYLFTTCGLTSISSIVIASLMTEFVGVFLSQTSFMGGMQGETPGFLTAMISWALYIFLGGVGNGQLELLARKHTDNKIVGIYADVSLVPLIATLETLAFACTKGACYCRDKSLSKWHKRVLAQLWDRILTGGVMRVIANVSSFLISVSLDNYAVKNNVPVLESHRPENKIISSLPTITIAIIPNLRGWAEKFCGKIFTRVYNT